MSEAKLEYLRNHPAHSNVLQTQLLQYVVSVLSVALALAINLLLRDYLQPTPTPPFFAAVMVSAWYGGLGPGLLATVLSTLTINYFLVEPVYTIQISNLGTFVRLGIFVMAALLINSLNEAQRSARQKAEANLRSLRESEARFGCLAESNIIGMLVADLQGTILEANANFLQLLGYTSEELRAGRLNWRELTPPESSPASEHAVQELLTTGACTPFEKEYIRKDGSRVSVLHGAVMTGEQTVTGFVLDLSKQKRIEAIQRSLHTQVQAANAQLETVLTSLNDQFLVLDQEWRYTYVSDRVLEVVGKPREELIGQCIWDLFPDIVDSPFYHVVHQAAAEQKILDFEYFYTPWQRWFENRVYPSSAGVSVLVTDITKRKQEEGERERLLRNEQAARQEAEAANRIKDEFLAVLSHELRSPLNPILGWARLLQTQKLDAAKTQQALATIERNAKLQAQLIEDLLDVSRILRGKLVLNTAPVNLVSTIEAALETVKLAVETKGIQIQTSFHPPAEQLMGDAARLQQVIWNLLSNAVKFTPAGGSVEIRLEKVIEHPFLLVGELPERPILTDAPIPPAPVSHYAQITISDTGKGISPSFLPYVFDYFRQEDGTTTRKFGGLGLGLAIVRHITELHGGTIWAESPGEGLGATFTIRLPLLPISVNVTEQNDTPTPKRLDGLKILAVDDDADIRELIEFMLQQAGADVCIAASAAEALQQLTTFSPAVLISDVGMPELDGYMLMQQVKTLTSNQNSIPAIALTAYAGEMDQQQAIAAGFQMHLAKPVEPEKLIEAIATLLNL